jgi:hypothetical protein
MKDLTPEQNKLLADTNLDVMSLIMKQLNISISDMYSTHKQAAGFIAGALASMIKNKGV